MEDKAAIRAELLDALRERAKELECLYRVEETLKATIGNLDSVLERVVRDVPPGFQYPEDCAVQVEHGGQIYKSRPFEPTPWLLHADIELQGRKVGKIAAYYLRECPIADVGPFLQQEVRLIQSIADRLGHHILYHTIKRTRSEWRDGDEAMGIDVSASWKAPLHLLREADKDEYLRLSRRILNHLCGIGVHEAEEMLSRPDRARVLDENAPERVAAVDKEVLLSDEPFELAARFLSDEEILIRVREWLREDKASTFNKVLNNPKSSLLEVGDALRRFRRAAVEGAELSRSLESGLRVSLIRRLLSAQLDYIEVAKDYCSPFDFIEIFEHMVMPQESQGLLGGKSAGLLLATAIMRRLRADGFDVPEIAVPRAWYVVSDGMMAFINHNDLEGIVEQKYKDVDQVRAEYPNIVQLFKSSSFPPDMVKGLSVALDDFGEGTPIIVRSSSLLEDRLGTAFSGKYKSLFLANQGSKKSRLTALLDAIAEVYASVFNSDPIEYRRERGLTDFHEEMGVLIEEVVGQRMGRYFLPAFGGVAFSRNEFRWSPRIRREDGIARLVPGLGTRAVDRLGDDYPILVVPGQPGLRANVAIDEIIRYSPKFADCIDLEQGRFVTVEIDELLREGGSDFPAFEKIFSVVDGDRVRAANRFTTDPSKERLLATFEGLISHSSFPRDLRAILDHLEARTGNPVDIEFAHDGDRFYLLQCRPQSAAADEAPAAIPHECPPDDVIFSANRYVSNGWIPDLTHIVYVDPIMYGKLPTREDMLAVGTAVRQLNKLLPKRQFVLMGPGRWGSRGDIKLGVPVTYSDINNTAMLIEVARKQGNYLPDLSFGTHFFQDLVESRIRYLPLYPDDEGIQFNERFLTRSPNLLSSLAPELAHLEGVIRVIDVPASADGRLLRILMNADLDEAMGILVPSHEGIRAVDRRGEVQARSQHKPRQYWRWRLQMAERIAAELDSHKYGVEALYLFGSVKNATAGPGSDIDLLCHFCGDEAQRRELLAWFDGWSTCLAEMNYLRTGYRLARLLDVHLVTDDDIREHTSFASKIGAVTDPARPLPLRATDDSVASRRSFD